MFETIFNEIFGNVDWEKIGEKLNEFEKNHEINEKDDAKSYFHVVEDEYEDGKHTHHKEKEVKDGKVVKDINNCCYIDSKQEENKAIESQKNKQSDTDVQIRELKAENKRLLEEIEQKNETIRKFKGCMRANEMTIERQNNDLEKLVNRNKELNEKLDNIKKLF